MKLKGSIYCTVLTVLLTNSVYAIQLPAPGPPPPHPELPIDSGLVFMLISGALLGIFALRKKSKQGRRI